MVLQEQMDWSGEMVVEFMSKMDEETLNEILAKGVLGTWECMEPKLCD